MLKSMTAYGRGSVQLALGLYTVEIQSVNKRHFDLLCVLPPLCAVFETPLRSLLSAAISRGQVTYRLRLACSEGEPMHLQVNQALVQQLCSSWRTLAPQLGYAATEPLPIALLTQREDLWLAGEVAFDAEVHWAGVQAATQAALTAFMGAKEREGHSLAADILARQRQLAIYLAEISQLTVGCAERHRDKLMAKLQPLISDTLLQDERLWREACLLAEKSDINEEIARLQVHLNELGQYVTQKMPCVGKQLEFLVQEIQREINTLGAKSTDIAIIRLTLAMKGEVEKIREQVHNVE